MNTHPFSLHNKQGYAVWRDRKLAAYPLSINDLMVTLDTSPQADSVAIHRIRRTASRYNMALYRLPAMLVPDKSTVHQLAAACGLQNINHNLCADADSLASLRVAHHTGQHEYIPYTNKPLNWHTDGYYNPPATQIYGMLLHCVQPALSGGESLLMDHEIAYILLREADPAYITALMHPRALTIPANMLNGEVIRPTRSGPVFSVTVDGYLHMRYSARQRNILWRNDPVTRAAERFLLDLWQQNSIYQLRYTLQAGEGLICNNVLHCRTGFDDQDTRDGRRLLYRGRYIDRITG